MQRRIAVINTFDFGTEEYISFKGMIQYVELLIRSETVTVYVGNTHSVQATISWFTTVASYMASQQRSNATIVGIHGTYGVRRWPSYIQDMSIRADNTFLIRCGCPHHFIPVGGHVFAPQQYDVNVASYGKYVEDIVYAITHVRRRRISSVFNIF